MTIMEAATMEETAPAMGLGLVFLKSAKTVMEMPQDVPATHAILQAQACASPNLKQHFHPTHNLIAASPCSSSISNPLTELKAISCALFIKGVSAGA